MRCEERLYVAGSDVERRERWKPKESVVKAFFAALGKCRGRPLYREIPGTPWFEYPDHRRPVGETRGGT
jgi:hypothetical protein